MKIAIDQARCNNCGMIKNIMNTYPLHNNLFFTLDRTSRCCDKPDYVWYKEKKPGKKGKWIQKYV